MGTVGCYTLDVYCDDPQARTYTCTKWPAQFTGRTEAECIRTAKKRGWKFGRGEGEGKGTARCPNHAGRQPSAGTREPGR